MHAPIVVGSASTTGLSSSASSITIARPGTPLRAGDVLITVIRTSGADSTVDFTSDGWERIGMGFRPQDAAWRVFGTYAHVVSNPATEPSAYTFTKAQPDSRSVGCMFVVRGADTTNLVAGESTFANTAAQPTIVRGNFSLQSVPTLVIEAWATEVVSPNSSTPVSTPPGVDEIALVQSSAGTGSTRTTLWVGAHVATSSPLDEASLTWTSSSSSAAWAVALRGTEGGIDPDPPSTRGRIQLRRGTTAEWNAANPVLASGEPGVDLTTGELKVGNGSATWADLPGITGGGGVIFVDDIENIPPGTPAGAVIFETG